MSNASGCRERPAKRCHQSSGKGGCTFRADLLAQNGSDSQLKSVPATGHSQSRMRSNSSGQYRICLQRSDNGGPIGVQVKHGAYALDDEEKSARIAKLNSHHQRILRLIERDFKITVLTVQRNGTAVAVCFYYFYARNRARLEKPEHSSPVVGRTKTKPKHILIFRLDRGL